MCMRVFGWKTEQRQKKTTTTEMSNIEINEDACENTSVKQKKDDKTLLTARERARSKGNKKRRTN